MAYTRRIKETAIRMMMSPENRPLAKIGEMLRIPVGTLKKWQQDLSDSGHAAPTNDEPAD